jgi:hypothetical protein
MGIQVPDLYEEQKDAVAGTDDPDDRHTDLDRTVEKVKDAIPGGKYARLDEVVGRIDHHYSSDRSAASSIKEHIRSGRIGGLSIRWRGAYLIKSE